MLICPNPAPQRMHHRRSHHRQGGMVLLIVIIMLVALTLAALALTRSVYTSNVIAGNLSLQRAATHSAEAGITAAAAWLESQNGKVSANCTKVLFCDAKAEGYRATNDDASLHTIPRKPWRAYWSDVLIKDGFEKKIDGGFADLADVAGNKVSYVIQRMCQSSGDPDASGNKCTVSPTPPASDCKGGSSCGAGENNLAAASPVYYRITVYVVGPRNTVSMVQAMISL